METTTDAAVTQQIETAEDALDDECKCLEDERAAFAQFRKRVASMDAHAPAPTATTRVKSTKNAIMGASEATASTAQIEQVRHTYRETVMNVPHYEEDYDQSLDEDIAEEFSPELANALATADSLAAPVQDTLLTGSDRATDGRTTLLNTLDREADTLQHAREELTEMNTALTEMNQHPLEAWSTTELRSVDERLADFETHCENLAAERQAELRSQRIPGPHHGDEDLNEYLYKSLPVTYPVLADLAEFTSLLITARQHLERAFITR
jgi:protein subunit release factor A